MGERFPRRASDGPIQPDMDTGMMEVLLEQIHVKQLERRRKLKRSTARRSILAGASPRAVRAARAKVEKKDGQQMPELRRSNRMGPDRKR